MQVTVTTTAIPTVPGGTYFACPGATVAALPATGSNLKWYSSATATTALVSTDLLATGTYYVSQTLNGCESQRVPKVVNVTNVVLPQAPATQTFCAGATIANLSATGQNKKWYMATSDGAALATATILQTGTYYVSQTLGSCESFRVPVAVTVNTVDPPTGQSIQIVETMPDEQPTIASLQASGQQVTWYASAANALSGTNPLPLTTIIISGSTYYAMQTNGNCRSASPLAVMVTIVLSRNDVSTIEFYYYPNPVTEKLTLWARRIIARVTVYNMLGQEVLQITPEATETSLDFSGLADGVYIIDAASENMVKRFRIIKQ